MIGRLVSLFEGRGEQLITLAVKADFREEFDELKDHEIDVEISKHRERRSRDANAYCWVLCDRIAEKVGNGTTKVDVYREAIRNVGVFKAFTGLSESDLRTLETAWGRLGIGWLTERAGDDTLICYYGSSEYNTKQISRLIDNLREDARELGIPVETPDEIAKMTALWAEKEEKKNDRNCEGRS